MYGSIFCSVTRKPRASRSDPIEAAARPLPNDDTTPPVTKMYFGTTSASLRQQLPDLFDLRRTVRDATVQPPVPQLGEDTRYCRPARDAERDDLVAGQGDGRAVEPEVPIERGPRVGVAPEPEPGERHGSELAEQARTGARRDRRGKPRQARPPLAEGVSEAREGFTRERQPRERGARNRRRLVGRERERAELDRLDAQAPLPRPREPPGQLGGE